MRHRDISYVCCTKQNQAKLHLKILFHLHAKNGKYSKKSNDLERLTKTEKCSVHEREETF